MAFTTFEKVIGPIIDDFEKGYVHRSSKADPGGPTNYGITLKTFRAWHGDPNLNSNALRVMPKSEAKQIYKEQYWLPIRADELPIGVDFAVFDFAINSGPGRAVMTLQEVLKVKQDGVIGLITMSAIKRYPGSENALIADLCDARLKFMKGLSNWPYNKNGWTRRVKTVKKEAVLMLDSVDHRPDTVSVSQTPKADSQNLSVSKALFSKGNVTVLTVAIPAVSGLMSDFQPAQYVIAAAVAGVSILALYWGYQKVRREAI